MHSPIHTVSAPWESPAACRFRLVLLTTVTCLLMLHGQATAQEPKTSELRPANLTVYVPRGDATLTVDGEPTRQRGITRQFISPPLKQGTEFVYTFQVVWEPNNYTTITRTRKVSLRAGDTVEVDLREADPKLPDKILVRYVPTPMSVVEAMLRLGEVGEGDVVYDLGCGDGRIVVTAVKKFNAQRGVGYDIDPVRIRESNANARAQGVEDKIEFRRGDVLDIQDLSTASVVMLYLGNDLNLRLRPILRKTLKPGSRIVSHRFILGDWKPKKTIVVTDAGGERYTLHLWIVGEDEPNDKK